MRIALVILGTILAVLGAAVAWLARESLFTFEPTPLELPVVVQPGWQTEASFTIQHAGAYAIRFDCENPPGLRPPDYSAWDTAVQSAHIRWEVLRNGLRVAGRESWSFPDNSYGGAGRTGHEIGRFHADSARYTFRVQIEVGDPTLNAHDPRVNVQLNAEELSDLSNVDDARELIQKLAWKTAIGGWLIAALGIVLVLGRGV